jgi:simple sugar transport system substrate-binding protein
MRQGQTRFAIHAAGLIGTAMLAQPLAASSAKADDHISIYFVGCAAPVGFHSYLAKGAEEAGKNLGVKVTYIYPDPLTIPNQTQKIEEAIAAKASGIAVCGWVEDSNYAEAAAAAHAAGIPIGNASAPPSGKQVRDPKDFFLFRTGSDERAAGALTAQRLIAMGVKGRVVISDQLPADSTCRDRANGEIETLKAAGIEAEFLETSEDPGQESETIVNYLRKHPDTIAATSVCHISSGLLSAKRDSGRNDLIITGYDLDPEALDAIQDGRQAFTIDQQQFWRGYMPVLLLTHYIKYGLTEANYFLTGPTVVDKTNIDQVAKLVTAGYR